MWATEVNLCYSEIRAGLNIDLYSDIDINLNAAMGTYWSYDANKQTQDTIQKGHFLLR